MRFSPGTPVRVARPAAPEWDNGIFRRMQGLVGVVVAGRPETLFGQGYLYVVEFEGRPVYPASECDLEFENECGECVSDHKNGWFHAESNLWFERELEFLIPDDNVVEDA